MTFDEPREIDSLCWQLRQSDYPRALNRARINNLFNGFPPYTAQEQEENSLENINDLSGPVLAHDARSQFYNAFMKPGRYFAANTEDGPVHKRQEHGSVVTQQLARIMKRSLKYTECFRSMFALDVLHGIGPSGWRNQDVWCPSPIGVEDVMIPGNTELGYMEDMPFFAIYHSFTAPELIKLTRGPKRDPAWNVGLVDACIKWCDQQAMSLIGTNWPEIWSPEKQQERVKSDGGFYSGDNVPTIDTWDFYFWNDEGKVSGWNRRMILDAWSWPAINASGPENQSYSPSRRTGEPWDGDSRNKFLYNPGKRKFANSLHEIVNWQFADLSPVAPFKYHSIRSLGWLLYAACHMQNRLYSKFVEAQFEQLMMYFQVNSKEDAQRALKVDLINRGFIDPSVKFIPAQERYQIRADLIQLGLNTNKEIIGRNSSSYTSNPALTPDKRELTATQWMGEANKSTQLVSAALNQAYIYQAVQYREIFRRFTRKHSKDADVQEFQAQCLRRGVPEDLLYNHAAWDIEPDRIVGAGNKTLEMAVYDRLMAARNLFDPEPQRDILRGFTLSLTDDAALANNLVPEQPKISDSVHDAQLAAGALMQGMPVSPKSGTNNIEYIEALLMSMAMVVQKISKNGDNADMNDVMGLANMADHIGQRISLLAQDPNEKERVKQYSDQLGKIMNMVKRFAQMLQEKMQAQGSPEQNAASEEQQRALAKIQADKMITEAKQANTRESHAQRTAQRQLQFEQEARQKQQQHELDMQVEARLKAQELADEHKKSILDLEVERRRAQLDLERQKTMAQIEIEKARATAEHQKRAKQAKGKGEK